MITDMQTAVHNAIREYLDSGKADQLILDRLAKLGDQARCCENCLHWNKNVEYCENLETEHGTMLPFQACEFFEPKEVTND